MSIGSRCTRFDRAAVDETACANETPLRIRAIACEELRSLAWRSCATVGNRYTAKVCGAPKGHALHSPADPAANRQPIRFCRSGFVRISRSRWGRTPSRQQAFRSVLASRRRGLYQLDPKYLLERISVRRFLMRDRPQQAANDHIERLHTMAHPDAHRRRTSSQPRLRLQGGPAE
jgi:hypothetical protein